jgi:hypothetical protein
MATVTLASNAITYTAGAALSLAGVAGSSVTSADTATVAPGKNVFIRVKNTGGSAVTVTVAAPGNTAWNSAIPDLVVTAPLTSGDIAVGPIDDNFADPADGLAKITVSGTVNVSAFTIY